MQHLPDPKNDFALSLPERERHREWIAGRAFTLLSHYWRDDDPIELTAAIGRDWADVLEGMPQDVIQKACVRYLRQEPRRKPTAGAIYELARELMPAPKIVIDDRRMTKDEQAAYQASVARDRINPQRKAEAEAILQKFKFTPSK